MAKKIKTRTVKLEKATTTKTTSNSRQLTVDRADEGLDLGVYHSVTFQVLGSHERLAAARYLAHVLALPRVPVEVPAQLAGRRKRPLTALKRADVRSLTWK